MNIPQTAITPFGYTGIPTLMQDDPNFNEDVLWDHLMIHFRILLWTGNDVSAHALWEDAALRCGATWAAAYPASGSQLILNVKMPNVRNTVIYQFNSEQVWEQWGQ